ncbi:MAG: AAA family ATPase [Pseudomonadota bacterium]
MKVIITGCSGGGKSTLIEELRRRGHATVPEPGRRIVQAAQKSGENVLPWINPEAFVRAAIAMSQQDLLDVSEQAGPIFFDRGLIDAVAGLEHVTQEPFRHDLLPPERFHTQVFFAPPWPEIYETDAERRHDLTDALAEVTRLSDLYPKLGYTLVALPKVSVRARADFVLDTLRNAGLTI